MQFGTSISVFHVRSATAESTGMPRPAYSVYCAHRTASVAARNAVRASVLIFDLGLPAVFPPLHFEANSKFLTGTSRFLLNFRVLGRQRASY